MGRGNHRSTYTQEWMADLGITNAALNSKYPPEFSVARMHTSMYILNFVPRDTCYYWSILVGDRRRLRTVLRKLRALGVRRRSRL